MSPLIQPNRYESAAATCSGRRAVILGLEVFTGAVPWLIPRGMHLACRNNESRTHEHGRKEAYDDLGLGLLAAVMRATKSPTARQSASTCSGAALSSNPTRVRSVS